MNFVDYGFIAAAPALKAAILTRGAQEGMLRIYPWFYVYIVCSLLLSIPNYILDRGSQAYGQVYFANVLVGTALSAGILLRLYRILIDSVPSKRRRIAADGALGLVLIIPLWILIVGGLESFLLYKSYLAYILELVLCLVVYLAAIRNRTLRLGRNWGGILIGFSIGAAALSLSFADFASDMMFKLFDYRTRIGYILSLTVLLYAMWRYAPPQPVSSVDRLAASRVRQGWIEAVRKWMGHDR